MRSLGSRVELLAPFGVDFQSTRTPETLTFNVGESDKVVKVPVYADTTAEPDETFQLTLSGATNASVKNAVVTGTIINDD